MRAPILVSALLPIVIMLLPAPAYPGEALPAETAVKMKKVPGNLQVERQDKTVSKADDKNPKVTCKRWKYATLSLLVTIGPLTLGFLAFLIVLCLKGKVYLEPFFGNGLLVELVVVILIAGNVFTLAVLEIFDASTVSTIYGGIVGYVLGRTRAGAGPQITPGGVREGPADQQQAGQAPAAQQQPAQVPTAQQ